jgi:hypothetical protein
MSGVLPSDFYNNTLSSTTTYKTETVPSLTDYLIDLDTGFLVVSDSGQFTRVSGLDAVIVQMWRKLNTKQGVFSIYSSSYGNLLDLLKGKGKVYGDTYASQLITSAIVDGTYVKAISNFKTTLESSSYTISYTANTSFGDTSQQISIGLD